jgi:hypothetical protein
MSPPPSSRLLILACSATKRDGADRMPAIERYDAPLWRTLRAVDPHGEKAKVAFLSAHLGFRAASTPIEMYNARMTEPMAAAMKAGDLGTRWPKPKTQRNVMPSASIPACTSTACAVVRGSMSFATSLWWAAISISTSCAISSGCSTPAAMSPPMRR